jgi:hypothetical protein
MQLTDSLSAQIPGAGAMNASLTTRPILRRGLSRVDAATYLGDSPSKFDELRKDGRVGPAKIVDGRKIWDLKDLDAAFDQFPSENSNAEDDWQASV